MKPGLSTVLVVEDDVDTRAALCEFLESEGFAVAVAASGKEAIDLLQRNATPCALLVDLTMPGVTGEQLVEHLRADARFASIPIAIVSASPARAPAGFQVFSKPIDVEALIAFVKDRCPVTAREDADLANP